MTALQLKTTLHVLIDTIENKNSLKQAYAFLAELARKNKKSDDYETLPTEVKKAIAEGLSQLDKGDGISYQDFRKELKQKHKL